MISKFDKLNHLFKFENLTILLIRTVLEPLAEVPIAVETFLPPHSKPSLESRQHKKLIGFLKIKPYQNYFIY